jgi:membrane fusion protein, multidrug efflux system
VLRRWLIWSIIMTFLILGYVLFRPLKNPSPEDTKQIKSGNTIGHVPVEIVRAKKLALQHFISFIGSLEADAQVTVYSEASGKLLEIHVEEGDRVKKGALVAVIDPEKKHLRIKEIEARLEVAHQYYRSAKRDFTRFNEVFQKGVISIQKKDEVLDRYQVTQKEIEVLKASLALARKALEDCYIYAPMEGIIAKRFIDPGEMVIESSTIKNTPIVTIVDINPLRVKASLVEKNISYLKKGQKARVQVDAFPESIFAAELFNIYPVVEPETRTVDVEIHLPNPDYTLKPGMFARIGLLLGQKEVLAIPDEALIKESGTGNYYAFAVRDGKAERINLELGIRQDFKVEVLKGLMPGDQVVLKGKGKLQDSIPVKVVAERN